MREIERTIVSALIFSQDQKLLMGRKDPAKGGVYPDCWHIPGGGVDEGESQEEALRREVMEEVGIDISSAKVTRIDHIDHGVAEKTLKDTGEKVLCRMEFNKFRVDLDMLASAVKLRLDDDLVEARWFAMDELPQVKQIPGGKEFFQEIGLLSNN
jgi:8-oxo-dGTP pyrophosphatase MutT (NUDIX family)